MPNHIDVDAIKNFEAQGLPFEDAFLLAHGECYPNARELYEAAVERLNNKNNSNRSVPPPKKHSKKLLLR